MNAAWVIASVVFSSVTAPVILVYLTNRQRHAEKEQDYRRQDMVAARAAEAARLLLASTERMARVADITHGKLDVIHTLVNSSMTAALQAELDATTRELALMREVIGLHEAAGRKPSAQAQAAAEATQTRIDELAANVMDRAQQAHLAEMQERHIEEGDR